VSETADKFAATVKEWVGSLREDVETCKAIVETEAVDDHARQFAATALNYLVTRLDLVPDHEPTIGAIDDAMVLRVCVNFATDHNVDEGLDSDVMVEAMRLSNEAEKLVGWLEPDVYAKFRKHCERLSETAVRGRTPELITKDSDARKQLFEEVADDLLRIPAATFNDPEGALRQLNSYLQAKLK
jgi:uncharacterized membrane protein YkvA (DUF1232 family)